MVNRLGIITEFSPDGNEIFIEEEEVNIYSTTQHQIGSTMNWLHSKAYSPDASAIMSPIITRHGNKKQH